MAVRLLAREGFVVTLFTADGAATQRLSAVEANAKRQAREACETGRAVRATVTPGWMVTTKNGDISSHE